MKSFDLIVKIFMMCMKFPDMSLSEIVFTSGQDADMAMLIPIPVTQKTLKAIERLQEITGMDTETLLAECAAVGFLCMGLLCGMVQVMEEEQAAADLEQGDVTLH